MPICLEMLEVQTVVSEAIQRLADTGSGNHSEGWKDKGRRQSDLSPGSVATQKTHRESARGSWDYG